MQVSDEVKELFSGQQSDSDIKEGIKELFKDKWDDKTKQHDIDLRTRLDRVEVRNMSIVSFLQSIDIPEGKIIDDNGEEFMPNLATGLDILAKSIKRHKISLDGKSREEIVELFKTHNELKDKKPIIGSMEGLR